MENHERTVETVKQVMPAVVSIAITKTLAAVEKEIPKDLAPLLPFQDGHLQVPDDMIDAKGMVKIGGGSGFIVEPHGVIVTNKHVVADKQAEYTVLLTDGQSYPAQVLARDPMDDVAILQIGAPERGLPTVALGDSSNLDLGAPVLAIGNALGLFRNTVSLGIVSGLSRAIRAPSEGEAGAEPIMQELRGLIQTDAAINPGNSGGPLVDLEGRAIGINAAVVFGAQNLGFAIPINAVKRDLADLKTHGRIRRPLLGLRYVTVSEGLREKMKLSVSQGALIIGQMPHAEAIVPGSPAAKAGIREKDIIRAVNGTELTAEHTIQDFLEAAEVGDVLKLTVLRGRREFETKVTLAERR